MEDHLFNLKFTAKSLVRESKKAEKEANLQKKKCKQAMEKNNQDGARIYAENAIREKNNALNYLKLSSRLDAVASRVNTAVKMNTLSKSMKGIVGSMSDVMQSMDPVKITNVMDSFEKQFENLDVTSKVMENSMADSTSATMPESQVDNLMQQVADEHGLEFQSQLGDDVPNRKVQQEEVKDMSEEDKLEERLRNLQG